MSHSGMGNTPNELLYGTLNVLVLKSLSWRPMEFPPRAIGRIVGDR
jgi:hypothetical protein